MWSWLEHHPGLGSWVQGFATTGALWFALQQVSLARTAARDKNLAMLHTLWTTMLGARTLAAKYCRELRRRPNEQRAIAREFLRSAAITTAQAVVAEVPIHELPSEAAIQGCLMSRGVLMGMTKVLEAHALGGEIETIQRQALQVEADILACLLVLSRAVNVHRGWLRRTYRRLLARTGRPDGFDPTHLPQP